MDTIKHLLSERADLFAPAVEIKKKIATAKKEGHKMESAIMQRLLKSLSMYRDYGGRKIPVGDNEMAKLAYEMYEVTHEFVENILHMNW